MDISLSGNTKSFSLIFILKLLNSLKKNGKVTLSGNSLNGELSLKDGDITHAVYNHFKGKEALKVLLAMTGNFQFAEGIISEEVTFPDGKGDEILKEAFNEWNNIQELMEIIPFNDVIFSIVPFKEEKNQEQVVFSKEEWIVISHINKYPLYVDLISNTGLGGLETGKILLDLHEAGYIDYRTDMTSLQAMNEIAGLNGNLSKFSLKDIFRLINDANVTGNLTITSNGNKADIYIENQTILDAKSVSWTGDLSIAEAMSWETGNCSFYKFTRQDKPKTLITITSEEIISGPSEKTIKLMEIAGEFKNSDAIFILNEDNDAHGEEEDFTFSKKDLAIMMNIDGKRTLNELSEQMDIPLYRLVENMYCLYQNGLISLTKKEQPKNIPLIEEEDTLLSLLHQEDKYDKDQLKTTILFSEIDKDFLPILTRTERDDVKASLLSQSSEGNDLMSLLNKDDKGHDDVKASLLSQSSEEDDLMSLLNKDDKGHDDVKTLILSQPSEEDDLMSLLNKADKGHDDVKASLLSQSSEGNDLMSLLNKADKGHDDVKASLLSQSSEGNDLMSLLNKADKGHDDVKASLLSQSSEEDDLMSLLNKEDEGYEDMKTSILSESSEEDDLMSLLNKEGEGYEDMKTSILSQSSEEDDLMSLLNKEDEGYEDMKTSILSQSSEEDNLMSLLNKEDEGYEDMKASLLSQSSEEDGIMSLLNKKDDKKVNSYNDLLELLNDKELPDKKKK